MDLQSLRPFGWKPFFESQINPDEKDLCPRRVASHFGSHLLTIGPGEAHSAATRLTEKFGDIAVGDWLLFDAGQERPTRLLERENALVRKAAGHAVKPQLIAANIDTLFIVSSCNQDFNLSRFERYLALAIESGLDSVVILTKADLCDDPAAFRQQVERLQTGLIVETIDARDGKTTNEVMGSWCRAGRTVALVGSSGVGKSTIAMSLGASEIATSEIREDDARGRHTTTARSIHHLSDGGLLIDTPGMRELQLPACETGVAELFEDVTRWFEGCRFRNCKHQNDEGCSVQAAIESGELDIRRWTSYEKLQSEQRRNSRSLAERRDQERRTGKYYKSVQDQNRKNRRD